MSFGIITGFTGTEHIASGDWKALNAGLAGSGNYVLSVGNKLAASLQTANKLRVLDGYGMMAGCQFGMPEGDYVDLVIENGAQGYNRIDLVVARYTRNSTTGIENVSLLVIKGTATTGTASMPSYNIGSVLSGSTCDFPLYKIALSGLTPTVTPMFDVLVPAKDAWDSISHASKDDWTVQLMRGITRYTKIVNKSFLFGTAGSLFASDVITETYPARVSSVVAVSVSLCDGAKDGWVGCVEAGGEGVNFKYLSWFNIGSPATRKFSISVDVLL